MSQGEKPQPYEIANPDDDRYHLLEVHPVKGGRYTTVFHGPPGTDVGDLHCELVPVAGEKPGQTFVVNNSGWKPSDEQMEMLRAGAHLRLGLWINPIPPVALSIEPPICGCHGEPMDYAFDGVEGFFTCRHIAVLDSEPTRNGNEPDALEQAHRDFTPESPGDDES